MSLSAARKQRLCLHWVSTTLLCRKKKSKMLVRASVRLKPIDRAFEASASDLKSSEQAILTLNAEIDNLRDKLEAEQTARLKLEEENQALKIEIEQLKSGVKPTAPSSSSSSSEKKEKKQTVSQLLATPKVAEVNTDVPRSLNGWLMKKGAVVKNWKRRWFVLTATSQILNYYQSNDASPGAEKGSIDLGTVDAVEASRAADAPDKGFAFDIVTKSRIYTVAADNEATFKLWMEVLRVRVKEAKPAQ
eukprot:TRINITY_DN4255_c0_g1_i4.p1 TRINITY_DN4255_c0_g1~~TRINITY_DN4255_c0_g1_i4.p1  ORF type:complete len:247 (-),score=72.06 TRINITY_DN4255_c0_g1_i4:60-800(-)